MSFQEMVDWYCVEIYTRTESSDPQWVAMCHQAGYHTVAACCVRRLFMVRGTITHDDVETLANELLTDLVTEAYRITTAQQPAPPHDNLPHYTIDVMLHPGVTDPAAENLVRAAHVPGIQGLEQAATGQRYLLWDDTLTPEQAEQLATAVFANPVVQHATVNKPLVPPFVPTHPIDRTVDTVALRESDDDALLAISMHRRLALDVPEMQAIRTYFQHEGRDPTDAELETVAQTWSEHCVHKTFRAVISLTEETESGTQTTEIDGLLRSYIRRATEELATSWVHSAFVDNAGIISFTDEWDLAFKVETHNHPSALEPFGGANTGVGGVVRDVIGVSARPIANTDVLCFGYPDMADSAVPAGVLHPRRIAAGVVHGIEDYGNKMGIPTVNGAVFYHSGYTANPLVFCGCLGILPHDSHPTEPQPGDLIIVIGGHTGRDGLRGATFSSMEMDETTSDIAGSAVQIGHPIHEKQVLDVVLQARDEQLYHAITDCGAGGLASAVGEMGQQLGARVDLATVPLKYPGLRPWEIWLSEAQERMVLAVPPTAWERLQTISQAHTIDAVCIGEFGAAGAKGRLQLSYETTFVGDIAMDFLHHGIPQRQLHAVWQSPCMPNMPTDAAPTADVSPSPVGHIGNAHHNTNHHADHIKHTLLAILAHPNVRSKENIVRRYDHEVQGGTAVKPLVGVACNGPSDATVLYPLDILQTTYTDDSTNVPQRGVALGVGICPLYGELDPYAMAWAAIDEAIRNVVAVGANPDNIALLDNFCWGNPRMPDRLGSLVRAVQGCYDAAKAYRTPFISGKDSLNNEYMGADGQKHAIPGTLLISSLGIVPHEHGQHTCTMDLKRAKNLLYIIGDTRAELGGSHYHLVASTAAQPHSVPQPIENPLNRLRVVHQAITHGFLQSCHDCSEGGMVVALAEMCLAGHLGADIRLSDMPRPATLCDDQTLLFAESLCRFIVEVSPIQQDEFETFCDTQDVSYGILGTVTQEPSLHVYGVNGKAILQTDVATVAEAWHGHLYPYCPPIASHVAPSKLPVVPTPSLHTSHPKVLILHANGTNRDRDAALACSLAGGTPDIVHINQLVTGERLLCDYQMIVVPGGFSYGDDLGAGTLWALDLRHQLGNDMGTFIASGKPVLGICNGFQALVRAGFIPGTSIVNTPHTRNATLTRNESAQFECRWVYLVPSPQSHCLFTNGLDDLIYCPVAHGEGRFITQDADTLAMLQQEHLIALTYSNAAGQVAPYPTNPNGSVAHIAGVCNRQGNVLGLMPHPENHIFPWQHPRWHRGERGMLGIRLFEKGVSAC